MKATLSKSNLRVAVAIIGVVSGLLMSSSHREAPLISNDPLADNTDLYAFKSPVDPNKIILIANYIPGQLPQGGPNYYQFGDNIRYEIHIDNNAATAGDEIIYRFTFNKTNEDPTTFFNIRLGKQNLKTTYTLERSINGGISFTAIVTNGKVPPPNIGPRSISGGAGLGQPDYNSLINNAIMTASTGEKVFAGTADDPFYVDLGGIFDLGDAPRQGPSQPEDGLKCKNVSTLAIQVDVSVLQKDHMGLNKAVNILDPNYVIGVWASASRRKIRTLNDNGTETHSGDWVQVSRLGMPLTNEVIIPIGYKDYWNSLTPYQDLANLSTFGKFFYNPELALYMDDSKFGGAIPAFKRLRIQRNSLGSFGFGNQQDGLYSLKGTTAVAGSALDDAVFGTLLIPAPGSPRSVDIWPIFNTGVPNLVPYQLATGKKGNPLATGKPFINNFLPNGGDMLRLNMAVPATSRTSRDFSNLGLIQAATLGITDFRFNLSKKLQFIPNMDGFPNGRRLEDDVTRIELQAVGGVVLAALGLPYDDYKFFYPYPLSPQAIGAVNYNTGINKNDVPLKTAFPFVQQPFAGTANCDCGNWSQKEPGPQMRLDNSQAQMQETQSEGKLGLSSPDLIMSTAPNPIGISNTLRYHVPNRAQVQISLYDASGKPVKILVNKMQEPGTYDVQWNINSMPKGSYFISGAKDGQPKQTITVVKD
jgi:hypothetical protein